MSATTTMSSKATTHETTINNEASRLLELCTKREETEKAPLYTRASQIFVGAY